MQVQGGYRTAGLGRGGSLRRLCCWLAVLPFLLFSLILPGTMIASDAQGSVTVVLCSGEGPVQMAVAADGSLVPTGEAPHGDPHACDWAPHGQPLLQVAVAAAPAPLLPALRMERSLDLPDHLYRAEMLAPSARGPPVLV
ncbi:hypothetical protein O4J55_02550 [Paracoccus sp. PXZ]